MKPRKSKFGLSQDDRQVWDKFTQSVERKRAPVSPQIRKPDSIDRPAATPHGAAPKKTPSRAPKTPSFATGGVSPNMDKRNFERLIKGQIVVDATLDLHGLTADQARQRLQLFVTQAHRLGHRLLLVITGKGQKSGTDEFNRPRQGVLRQGLPDWLSGPSLSHLVLQVRAAQRKHGGEGAFYVYLRRKR